MVLVALSLLESMLGAAVLTDVRRHFGAESDAPLRLE